MNANIDKTLEEMKAHRNRVRLANRQLMECEWKAKQDGMNEMIKIVEQLKIEEVNH